MNKRLVLGIGQSSANTLALLKNEAVDIRLLVSDMIGVRQQYSDLNPILFGQRVMFGKGSGLIEEKAIKGLIDFLSEEGRNLFEPYDEVDIVCYAGGGNGAAIVYAAKFILDMGKRVHIFTSIPAMFEPPTREQAIRAVNELERTGMDYEVLSLEHYFDSFVPRISVVEFFKAVDAEMANRIKRYLKYNKLPLKD